MAPFFDVYAWVRTEDRAAVFRSFIDEYVDTDRPGNPAFEAFVRMHVEGRSDPGDAESLADLSRTPGAPDETFSLYLRSRTLAGAIITTTDTEAVVLGLSVNDPMNDPEVWKRGRRIADRLAARFGAEATICGVELAPPHTVAEWNEEALVQFRRGTVG